MSSGDYLSLVYLEGSFRKAFLSPLVPQHLGLHLKFHLGISSSTADVCYKVTCFLVFIILCGFGLNFNKIHYLHPMCPSAANIFHSRMLLYLAKQGSMWECNLKKPTSISFLAWEEMQCCGGVRPPPGVTSVGAIWGWQCCVALEKRVKERQRESGCKKKRGKGNLPFYFLQKLQWSLLWLWVYRIGFGHFREEGFESEVAAKCWEQPLGRNRSKSQVAWGNLM